MRKLVILMNMLLPLGLFCACSSDVEFEGSDSSNLDFEDVESINDSIDESVRSFFEKELQKGYLTGGHVNDHFVIRDGFFFEEENTCYRINSMEELASLYHGSDVLPEINFEKYTLLLGCKVFHDANTDVDNTKLVLVETPIEYQLNLCTRHLEGEWASCGITLEIIYYGFYPKLKNKNIKVNLIYE